MLLTTSRLTLVACPLEVAQALLSDHQEAAQMLRVGLPSGWPSPEIEGILPPYVQELFHDPEALGWGIWIVVQRDGQTIVGDAGFKGRPAADGTVEIGYETAPAYRRRGYATEAVRALVGWAFTQPAVKRVIAECALDNDSSTRVLAKTGFQLTDRTNESLYWEIARRI